MSRTNFAASCLAFSLAAALVAGPLGCGGSEKKDDANREYGWETMANSNAPPTSWGNAPATGNTDANGPSAADVSPDVLAANDRQATDRIARAKKEFDKGDYRAARAFLSEANSYNPLSQPVAQSRHEWNIRVDTFGRAFAGIAPLTANPNIRIVFFHGSGKVTGVILEDDSRKNSILVRDLAGQFITVDRNRIGDIQPLDTAKQREQLDNQYGRLKYEFSRRQSPTAVDEYKFAQAAWKYGRAEDAHQHLVRAFELDADIAQTVAMEGDPQYQKFAAATASGNLDEARKLLRDLGEKYPNAQLFKDARVKLDQAARVERPASGTPSGSPPVVSEAVEKQIFAAIDSQATTAAAEMKAAVPVDTANNQAVQSAMSGPADEMVREADRHFAEGKKLDDRSLPGMPNADELLQQAVYHYRLAQELYANALRRGGNREEIDAKQVQTNKALFWCRKRMPIH